MVDEQRRCATAGVVLVDNVEHVVRRENRPGLIAAIGKLHPVIGRGCCQLRQPAPIGIDLPETIRLTVLGKYFL